MLWKYSLQFNGLFDAPSNLVDARRHLIERIKTDPAAFISKIEPASRPALRCSNGWSAWLRGPQGPFALPPYAQSSPKNSARIVVRNLAGYGTRTLDPSQANPVGFAWVI